MPMDIAALMQSSTEAKPSPLMDALDQMRALCDKIEAEQMAGRKNEPETPAESAAPDEEAD
jgi:hypothetical protein